MGQTNPWGGRASRSLGGGGDCPPQQAQTASLKWKYSFLSVDRKTATCPATYCCPRDYVSRHQGGPIEGLPEAPRTSEHYRKSSRRPVEKSSILGRYRGAKGETSTATTCPESLRLNLYTRPSSHTEYCPNILTGFWKVVKLFV